MYHSAMKMKETLPFATIQTDLRGLCWVISHVKKDVYCLISLTHGIEKTSFHRRKMRFVDVSGGGLVGVGLSKGGQKIQTFSYRVRKYWGIITAQWLP